MKKIILAVALLCSIGAVSAQPAPRQGVEQEQMEPEAAPTVYQMADEVRNAFGLDYKQFSKVYQAYEKFNKAIFGSTTSEDMPAMGGGRRGGGGPGGPGGGGGFGGGMPGGGGPGGGGGFGGGMPGGGGPGGGGSFGDMPEGRPQWKDKAPKPMSEKDLEKRRKKIEKQEAALAKKVAKVLGDDARYQRWLEIRAAQSDRQFPVHRGPRHDGDFRPEDAPNGGEAPRD